MRHADERRDLEIERKEMRQTYCNFLVFMVGETGFEPATPCTPCRCATKLRYSPADSQNSIAYRRLQENRQSPDIDIRPLKASLPVSLPSDGFATDSMRDT